MPLQYRALWSIPNAGPSVSTFHFLGDSSPAPLDLANAVRSLFSGLTSAIPNDVTISFDTEITAIDVGTGQLINAYPVTPPTAVVGSNAGTWAGGSGLRIDWLTAYINRGRRVRGRTFIVPLASGGFGNDGRVSPTLVTQATTAATSLITGADAAGSPLAVYSRPIPGDPGSIYPVTVPSVPGLAASLRGRKY